MKKITVYLFVFLLICSLFSGCKNNNGVTPTPTPTATAQASPSPTPSDYNYAKGKYDKTADGWPKEKYVYDLPLSKTNEEFSLWTVNYTPQYLPEDGYNGLSMYKGMREKTGVNINYILVSSDTRAENFSTLLVSDSLPDMMSQAIYFYTGGSYQNAIDDGYFANLYPYLDYMPNYCRELYERSQKSDILDTAFYKDDTVVAIYGLYETPLNSTGYFLRQDWLDDLDLGKASDLKTYDDLYEILKAFKTAYGAEGAYPMMIFNVFELQPVNWVGYNTTPYSSRLGYVRVVDEEVQFCGTTGDDKALMTMLNQWWTEGLIDPNYAAYTSTGAASTQLAAGNLGYVIFTPSEVPGFEQTCVNKDCRYEPVTRLKQYEDQIIQWGLKPNNITYGSCTVSANCKNIELVTTYLDWMYSAEGSEWTNWGPEGEIWELNKDGDKQLTDWALKHEMGTAWLQDCWTFNELADAGIQKWTRNYAYPGGERFVNMFKTWDIADYGGEYDWPAGVKFTDEQQSSIDEYWSDCNTYFTENFMTFFQGSKPMSQWEDYVSEIMDLGLSKVRDIYQEAYDDYKSA